MSGAKIKNHCPFPHPKPISFLHICSSATYMQDTIFPKPTQEEVDILKKLD